MERREASNAKTHDGEEMGSKKATRDCHQSAIAPIPCFTTYLGCTRRA